MSTSQGFSAGPGPEAARSELAPRRSLSRARIDLTLARLEGLFGFVFALLSVPALQASAGTLKPEWAWGITIAMFGSMALGLVCSLIQRGIRIAMGAIALVFAVLLVLWPFAVKTPDAAVGQEPWLWYIVIVAIAAAALSFPTVWAAVYTVAVPLLFAVLRVLPAGGGASWLLAVLDALYALVLGSFVVIVISALRSAASRVDEAQATAARRYAEAVGEHAAEAERTRVDTVIHDRVLSTLLAAARSASADDRVRVVQMAERALVALQSADVETDAAGEVPVSVLAERARALAETLEADIRFAAEGDLDALVPGRVIEGVYSATVQAVVNSVRHAGAGAARSISVHGWGDAGFSLIVADTGAGFEIDRVPADRLGLRISIRERVDSVGGVVQIRSAPGAGTSVIIEWSPGEGAGGFE